MRLALKRNEELLARLLFTGARSLQGGASFSQGAILLVPLVADARIARRENKHARDQSQKHRGGHDQHSPVSLRQLLQRIHRGGWPRRDRLMLEVPQDIRGQAIGCLVTARAVLLQTFHHDPIQIAAHQTDQMLLFLEQPA